jgi:hypothetical protein
LLLRPGTTDIPLAEKVHYPDGLSTEQSRNLAAANRLHGMQDTPSTMQHEQDVMEALNSKCKGMQKCSNKIIISASYKMAICHISS